MRSVRAALYSVTQSSNERPRRALLVGVPRDGQPVFVVEEHLDELAALADSAGAAVVGRVLQARKAPDAGFFVGRGKAQEIARRAAEVDAEVIVFDDDLSGSQVKNLEEVVERQVMDRSGLILELFHQRARSREARTQVELAQLEYLLPRLTRRWRHLSRQVGGIGVRGGEGETQLEADRRVLRHRIGRLKRDLAQIERMRAVQRRGRQRTPVVALAGYTNAGKSTLFNLLTHADVLAEDRLFATLDARVRRGALGPGQPVVLFADTVGFIRKLPHDLVASFRSTLEEVTDADLVLHVIDRSHPAWQDQRDVAEQVLTDLGVDPAHVLTVFNKIDLLTDPSAGGGPELWLSAATGAGTAELRTAIALALRRAGAPLRALA